MVNLAERMRPKSISDVVGQEHLTSPDKILGRIVKSKIPTSLLLYSPPGTGKTSIARALSNDLGLEFERFNASVDNKEKLKNITQKSESSPLVLLVDEIHRLTKPLQDHLLPYMEQGDVTLVGATTENPYISINPALRSRATILELKPIGVSSMVTLLERAVTFLEVEQETDISITPEQLAFIASSTNGDARSALNALELVVLSADYTDNGLCVDTATLEQILGRKAIAGDKDGDEHYNLLSAFQKSIRGSDVNASLHYLARLIEIGDLQAICRRLSIIAYEDISVANQPAVINANLAIQVAEKTGLPEARIPLANAVIELASSKKSNIAVNAIDMALADLQTHNTDIPHRLRDTHFKGASELGHTGYLYPHDYQHHYIAQQYIPTALIGRNYVTDNYPVNQSVAAVVAIAAAKTKQDISYRKDVPK